VYRVEHSACLALSTNLRPIQNHRRRIPNTRERWRNLGEVPDPPGQVLDWVCRDKAKNERQAPISAWRIWIAHTQSETRVPFPELTRSRWDSAVAYSATPGPTTAA
jgi:hypothetical protein